MLQISPQTQFWLDPVSLGRLAEYENRESEMKTAIAQYDKLLADYKAKEAECDENALALMNLQVLCCLALFLCQSHFTLDCGL